VDGFDGVGMAHAFRPIADSLREDGFAAPDAGWTAEQVGAHVALNNEFWTEVALAAARGGELRYDNGPAVDPGVLDAYVSRFGSSDALADRVLASADELEAAFVALTPHQREQSVQVTIRDGGEVVVEGPHRLATFVEINATRHVAMHLDQLLALRG